LRLARLGCLARVIPRARLAPLRRFARLGLEIAHPRFALGLRPPIEVMRAARLALDLLHRVAHHRDDAVGQIKAAFGAVGVDLAARFRLLLRHESSRRRRSRRASLLPSFTVTCVVISGFGRPFPPPPELPLPAPPAPPSSPRPSPRASLEL